MIVFVPAGTVPRLASCYLATQRWPFGAPVAWPQVIADACWYAVTPSTRFSSVPLRYLTLPSCLQNICGTHCRTLTCCSATPDVLMQPARRFGRTSAWLPIFCHRDVSPTSCLTAKLPPPARRCWRRVRCALRDACKLHSPFSLLTCR